MWRSKKFIIIGALIAVAVVASTAGAVLANEDETEDPAKFSAVSKLKAATGAFEEMGNLHVDLCDRYANNQLLNPLTEEPEENEEYVAHKLNIETSPTQYFSVRYEAVEAALDKAEETIKENSEKLGDLKAE